MRSRTNQAAAPVTGAIALTLQFQPQLSLCGVHHGKRIFVELVIGFPISLHPLSNEVTPCIVEQRWEGGRQFFSAPL